MPSVNFEDFEILWNRVESKFVNENEEAFTLDGLRDLLISQNLVTPLTNFKFIEERFLRFSGLPEKPQNVNLPYTIFSVLYSYVGIKGIFELKGHKYFNPDDVIEKIKEESERKKEQKALGIAYNFAEIGFLGREKELSELENFLQSSEERIFALYGVPMIGKTKLVSHFLENSETAKTYNVISIGLNPPPENTEQRIQDEIFHDKKFNDFSAFSENTLIIIRNFEETLKWTGNFRDLHDIKDEYQKMKIFLEKAAQIGAIKLILESRFQIHFEVFFADWKTKTKTLPTVQLEGIEKDKFWHLYESKGFTYQQFEELCKKFDNHTGLLALAYNDVEFLYQNRLIEAVYAPTVVTRLLWDLVERIIDRLATCEIWILCALTFLQKPIKKEDVYEDFLTLQDFEDELQIEDSFNSLTIKLLVELVKGEYDLNPYIREVCYTFLKARRRNQMQTIHYLPYFKRYGRIPIYDEIHQAQDRGDFQTFFRLIKANRKKKNYKEVHSYLEKALIDPKFKEVIVLNEIAITFKDEGKLNKAIDTLEKARHKYPNDVKILNELGICYRENEQLDKAIDTLEEAKKKHPNNGQILNELAFSYQENKDYESSSKIAKEAIKLKNYPSYTILATTYQKIGDIDAAYRVAEEGMKTSGWDKSRLTNKFQELKKLIEKKQSEEEIKKLKVFLSYSHEDEEIKDELVRHLSMLKKSGKISTWNDRELPAGEEWNKTIKAELEEADIILLLISANFIDSDYIHNTEIKRAIEKHENGTAVVIPIFCKACDFDEMLFTKLQGLPRDGKFIASQSDRDQAYAEVAKGIRKVVESKLS